MTIKKMLPFIFRQTVLISFFMLLLIGIEGIMEHIAGNTFYLIWYMPMSIVIVGFLCSFPMLVLFKDGEYTVSLPRVIIHGFLCYAIVMTSGYLFRWYTQPLYFLITSVLFIVIYALVWITSILVNRAETRKINKILEQFRDEE